MSSRPRLFVISGPSGAGKGTLVKELVRQRPDMTISVSVTTRPRRRDERDGEAYYFVSKEEFEAKQGAGLFLESAIVHGHYYGTQKETVDRALEAGLSVILEIDVQGAGQIRESGLDAVFIYINAPSEKELRRRLVGRETESAAELEKRLMNAKDENAQSFWFEHIIINDDIEEAVKELIQIVDKETRQ